MTSPLGALTLFDVTSEEGQSAPREPRQAMASPASKQSWTALCPIIMAGSLLAGTIETPGEVHRRTDGTRYKTYRGMASKDAQQNWRSRTGSIEGVSTVVPFKGPVGDVLEDLKVGIRSGFSYSGARNIVELQSKAVFVTQTPAGQIESTAHILRGRDR